MEFGNGKDNGVDTDNDNDNNYKVNDIDIL